MKLIPDECRLLCELVINEGKVLFNQMLLWGSYYINETLYIKIFTQGLKEKLEEEPDNRSTCGSIGSVRPTGHIIGTWALADDGVVQNID